MIQGRVLYRMGWPSPLATVPGALLGATLVQYLDSRWFTLLFALFLLALAGLLLGGTRSSAARTGSRLRRS